MLSNPRRQAEKLLGAPLPGTTREVRLHRWQPNPDLAFFQAWLRFTAPRAAFDDLVAELGLRRRRAAVPYLPAPWDGPPDIELPWWDPPAEPPSVAAACAWGANGWLIARWEDGRILLTLTDSAATSGTPGPW